MKFSPKKLLQSIKNVFNPPLTILDLHTAPAAPAAPAVEALKTVVEAPKGPTN